MHRHQLTLLVCALISTLGGAARADALRGDYLESRTCDVFTGPCFANAEVSLAGKEAVLAWQIETGSYQGVDLAGLSVVMAIRASDTLGFGGKLSVHPEPIRSVVLVDQRANPQQRAALVAFARERAGEAAGDVVRVDAAPIEMAFDHVEMVAHLRAGSIVEVETRKLGGSDCICSNEQVFYPPLAQVQNCEPAYTVAGQFCGRGLGATWDNTKSRSSFLGTFGP